DGDLQPRQAGVLDDARPGRQSGQAVIPPEQSVRAPPARPPRRGDLFTTEQLEEGLLPLFTVHLDVNNPGLGTEHQPYPRAGVAGERLADAVFGRPGLTPVFADRSLLAGVEGDRPQPAAVQSQGGLERG